MNSNRFGALRLCTDLLENRVRIDLLLREYRPLIVELADVDLEPTSVGENDRHELECARRAIQENEEPAGMAHTYIALRGSKP